MELEERNFRVKSDDWARITVGSKEYKINPEKDIWEFLEGNLKGEQLFTWEAAVRETEVTGKRIPTAKEFRELLRTREDMPNLAFAGRYGSGGKDFEVEYYRKVDAYFWSYRNMERKTAWICFIHSDERDLCHEPNIIGYDDGEDDDGDNKIVGLSVRCIKE